MDCDRYIICLARRVNIYHTVSRGALVQSNNSLATILRVGVEIAGIIVVGNNRPLRGPARADWGAFLFASSSTDVVPGRDTL